MTDTSSCEHCGKPVGPNAPSGLCPGCVLRTAIETGATREQVPLLPKLRYFGDYELLEELARGGMGVVYRARQVSLDRIVAIKMMRPGVLSTEDEIRRFQTEARTAANMQHPNIVAIHEVGEFDGLHYFSMDFVEGPSLAELVRQGPLAPIEAARYVRLLAEAVHYAHGKGILHRDLKPSNVLVDDVGRPRITDFGLARPLDGSPGMTVTGTLMGTPAYMPPEQAAAEGAPPGPQADCYSLGAILYELLTGKPPFDAASPVAIVRRVLEHPPEPPRTRVPAIPRDLDAIAMRCLEKDPRNRYATAADLASDLDRFLRGEPVMARPASRRAPRWALVAAALVVMAAGVWISVARHRPVSQHAGGLSLGPGDLRAETISVAPDGGEGARQSFTFRYAVPDGISADTVAEIEFLDPALSAACRVFVHPQSERVQLQVDPLHGTALRIGGEPGSFQMLENSVCAVDLAGVAIAAGDTDLEIRLPMQFKPAFAGTKRVGSWILDPRTGERARTRIHALWTVQ